MTRATARVVLAFTTGLFLACAAVQSAHGQNIIVPETQYRLDPIFIPALNRMLPPLPDSVPTSHGWSVVRLVAEPACAMTIPPGVAFDGCVDNSTRVIEVRADESLAERWHTLRHEMAHLMWLDTGVVFPSGVLEERACDVVATWALMEQLLTHGRTVR